MGKIVYLSKPVPVMTAKEKVVSFPLFRVVFDKIKSIQNDIYNKKLNFLYEQAYQYFYDLLETRSSSDVDFPDFIYEEQRKKRASDEAVKALLEVIKDSRVNECYAKRIKELKQVNNERR